MSAAPDADAKAAAAANANATADVNVNATADAVSAAEPVRPSDDDYAARQEALLAAIHGRIEPVRTSPGYVAAALLVSVVMILLPILYVAFIASVGYATYWHAVNNTGILETKVRGKGYLGILAAYLAPIVVGGVVVLFLIKPLFARPPKSAKPRSLSPDDEPLLFAFVNRLCQAVGASPPRRIDVDLQVNASASFRRGIWSMLGNDLVLTIGLPLTAGLSARQFAGVLAHEFGHFTQGAGMRLSYLIRSISMWFARVVYQRDSWDERLDAWCRTTDAGWLIFLTGHLAKFCVKIGRWVLTLLMYVGNAVSGVMLRQMEYDADLHEIRLSGSQTFGETSRRLGLLNASLNASYGDLNEFYRDGRLGDNLPALVVANDATMPDEVRKQIAEATSLAKTGFFDTHPCDTDRIAYAEQINAPGIFHYDGPAADLFRNFTQLARHGTLDLYRNIFGEQVQEKDLQAVDHLMAGQKAEQELRAAVGRYFLDGFRLNKSLPLSWDQPRAPDAQDSAVLLLKTLRDKVAAERGTATAETFEPTDAFVNASAERLTTALRLLAMPEVRANLPDGEALHAEVTRVYSAARVVQRDVPLAAEIGETYGALGTAFDAFIKDQKNDTLRLRVVSTMEQLHGKLKSLHTTLAAEPYPLDHGDGELSVAKFLLKDLPPTDDLGAIHEAASRFLENYAILNLRLTGRLTTAAEKVETSLGLTTLIVA